MNHDQFRLLTRQGLLLLDGATGTHLQAAGMPPGHSPETWVLDNPVVLQDLQNRYMAAGSSIIFTATFGANRIKMTRHGLDSTGVERINRQLAEVSVAARDAFCRQHAGRQVLVAGDIGPTGSFLYPAGDLSLSELINIFREQVRGLLAGGVDLFVLETMMDLAEVRAAVLAVQCECSLPVLASLTFAENGHTLTGNSPVECLITLAALGVDAFGINCSFGPERLGELIEPLRSISPIPLLLKPNAGLPVLIDGQTVFPMQAEAFADVMVQLAREPVRLLGGCCGTSPDHLAALSRSLQEAGRQTAQEFLNLPGLPAIICSARQSWPVGDCYDLPVVECTDPDNLLDDAVEVLADAPSAIILDFDSLPGDVPRTDVLEAMNQLQVMVTVPLVFRAADPGLLEELLHHYCGRAGVAGPLPATSYGALLVCPAG